MMLLFYLFNLSFILCFYLKFSMWSVVLLGRISQLLFFLVWWVGQCSDTKNHLPNKS